MEFRVSFPGSQQPTIWHFSEHNKSILHRPIILIQGSSYYFFSIHTYFFNVETFFSFPDQLFYACTFSHMRFTKPELPCISRFATVTAFKSNKPQPVSSLPYVSSFELPWYSQGATERNKDTQIRREKLVPIVFQMKVWRGQVVHRPNPSTVFL
jgi:hypothetical protein